MIPKIKRTNTDIEKYIKEMNIKYFGNDKEIQEQYLNELIKQIEEKYKPKI